MKSTAYLFSSMFVTQMTSFSLLHIRFHTLYLCRLLLLLFERQAQYGKKLLVTKASVAAALESSQDDAGRTRRFRSYHANFVFTLQFHMVALITDTIHIILR